MPVHREVLQSTDVTTSHGLPNGDFRCPHILGPDSEPPLVEGLVAADAMLHRGLVRRPELTAYIDAHAGSNGVRQARRVADPGTPGPSRLWNRAFE